MGSQTVLVQPRSGGRLSGGYLYNRRMARSGAWRVLECDPHELPGVLERLGSERCIADSLWLTPAQFPLFASAQARGARLAFLLHSFPSLIAAAEQRRPLPSGPSSFEIHALERVGRSLVVGPHYRNLLAGAAVTLETCSPGIDDGFRQSQPQPQPRVGPCRFLSLAALTPRKGLLDAAEALRSLGRPEVYSWTVVGSKDVDSGYASELSQATQALPVRLVGQLPPQEVADLLRKAHALLMPSYDENHPLVLLEAIAAGVPSVAYAAGAAREILRAPELGLVAPVGDRLGFAGMVRCVVEDESLRSAMAQACTAHARQLPSWEQAAQAAAAAVERLLGP